MAGHFSYEEREIQRAVRRFSRDELLGRCRDIEERGELPEALKTKLLSMGILQSFFPEQYGGADGSFTGFVLALKELSYATLVPSWMLFENFMLAYPLLRYGSPLLKRTYLPDLLSLKKIGALAFTESETGSDPAQIKTAAKKADKGWVINGSKRFITNSGICDHMILFARSGDGITAFLVNAKQEGYRAGKREVFIHERSLDNGDVHFEDYFAPDDHVIGAPGEGFEILLQTEAAGKIAFCSLFLGVAERALDLSLQYAGSREHRGTPIGHKFQLTQFKLARMAARLEAMKAYLYRVCGKSDRGETIFAEAAALKLLIGTDIREIVADAMEVHGAYGLSEDFDVARLYRIAVSAQAVMGSLDIQRVIVAKELLTKGAFGD